MPSDGYFLTKEGLKKIKEEYSNLYQERERMIKEGVPPTLESEEINPDYISFKEKLEMIEKRMEYLGEIIEKAKIIRKPSKKKRGMVDLGSKVLVEENGKLFLFEIVDTIEADPSEGKISIHSPVGKALLGRKIGDIVLVSSQPKKVYKIKKISY